MQDFWNSSFLDLSGWVLLDWWRNRRLCQEWLRGEFGDEKKMLYEPIVKRLKRDKPIEGPRPWARGRLRPRKAASGTTHQDAI